MKMHGYGHSVKYNNKHYHNQADIENVYVGIYNDRKLQYDKNLYYIILLCIFIFNIIQFISSILLFKNDYKNDTCISKPYIPLPVYFIINSISTIVYTYINFIRYKLHCKDKHYRVYFITLCINSFMEFIGIFLIAMSCYKNDSSIYNSTYIIILYISVISNFFNCLCKK